MQKYYKVVYKNHCGQYVSCCAGNEEAYEHVHYKLRCDLKPIYYELNQWVSSTTPMLVFSNIDYAKLFLFKTFRVLDNQSNFQIFEVDVILSEYEINNILVLDYSLNGISDFPLGTVFVSHVKLLNRVFLT